MKTLLLSGFLLCCTISGQGQARFDPAQLSDPKTYGGQIASTLKTIELPEYRDTARQAVFLQNGFRSFRFRNEQDWLRIKDTVDACRIDVVYSKYPLREGVYREIYPLLLGRLKALIELDPNLNDPDIACNKVLQTNCLDDKQVNALFHGVVIYYKLRKKETAPPASTAPPSKSEFIGREQARLVSEQNTLEELQQSVDNIRASFFMTDSMRAVLDKLPLDAQIKSLKQFLEAEIAKEPEIDLSKASEKDQDRYTKMVREFLEKYPARDNVVSVVFDRHPEWRNCLVINDWTGSMYGYGAQVLAWHLANLKKSGIYALTLFNDGDTKPDREKRVGETGGIYSEKADNITRMVKLFNYIMLKGSGGDGPENDIEGILKAMEEYEHYSEIVLIADNNACVRDIGLADRIGKPVRVIVCGYKPEVGISPDYVYLAKITGGGIYTIEDDLEQLQAELGSEGEVKNLLDTRFKVFAKKCNPGKYYEKVRYSEYKLAVKHKRSVTDLVLERKGLKDIPKKVYKMKNLKLLDLSDNKLSEVPANIRELGYLKSIDLSHNTLDALPPALRSVHFIESMDLSDNQFSTMPGCVLGMKYLRKLNLSNNKLSKLDKNMNMKKLEELDLSFNEIGELSRMLVNLKKLSLLNLSHNRLYAVDESLGQLAALESLDLSYNQLDRLPETIGRLVNLRTLKLEGNRFSEQEQKRIREALPETDISF